MEKIPQNYTIILLKKRKKKRDRQKRQEHLILNPQKLTMSDLKNSQENELIFNRDTFLRQTVCTNKTVNKRTWVSSSK